MKTKILIIDDDKIVTLLVEKMIRDVYPNFKHENFIPCHTKENALEKLKTITPEDIAFIVLDGELSEDPDGQEGYEILQTMNQYQSPLVVLLSSSENFLEKSKKFNVLARLRKGQVWEDRELFRSAIRNCA